MGGSFTSSRAMMTPSTIVSVRNEGLSGGGYVADSQRHVGSQRAVVAIFLPGLVAIESVGPEPNPGRHRGCLRRLHRPARQLRKNGDGVIAGAQFAGRGAAKHQKIDFLKALELAGTDYDQARGLEALRRQDIERGPDLPLELVGSRRALDDIGRRPQRLGGIRAELQRFVAKHHQSAPCDDGKPGTKPTLMASDIGKSSINQGCPACLALPWPQGHIGANY